MKKIISVLNQENIVVGYLYFYVHLVTEILSFYTLSRIMGNSALLWIIPFFYDAFAFVPQSIIGYYSDKYPKIKFGLIGVLFLTMGFIIFNISNVNIFISIMIISLGNAFIHVNGAEVTLRTSNGKLSHSAIFVSGGSFGVIIGKLLSKNNFPFIILILLSLTMIPFIILAEEYKIENEKSCAKFNYHNSKLNPNIIIILAVCVVIIRGYMGYGIPTSWNKTVFQAILLYSFMGIGKALGGILIDIIGMKKVAIISTIGSLPFLIFGDKIMFISLIGVMLFSMTMAITLGLLTSVLKNNPGLAFGWTTIGLFIGTIPIFFIRFSTLINCLVIIISTIVSIIILLNIIRERLYE